MPNRYYSSTAIDTSLSVAIGGADTSITVGSYVGYPASFPFTIAIDFEAAAEELVTVTAASGTVLTVVRAQDGTTARSHAAGAKVKHIVSARDFAEPQAHMSATTAVHGIADTAKVVITDATQTLTGKTISGASNTLSNIPESAVTNLPTDLASKAKEVVALNAPTGNYTLQASDAISTFVTVNSATAATVTVPPNVFTAGNIITIAALGAGRVTVAPGAGVTIVGTPGLSLRVQYSAAGLFCIASNSFLLVGDLSA